MNPENAVQAMKVNCPVKIVFVELTDPPLPVEHLEGYSSLRVLARFRGAPLGWVELPVIDGRCTAAAVRRKILERYRTQIVTYALEDDLGRRGFSPERGAAGLLDDKPEVPEDEWPLVTVAVCTRDRTEDLGLCLDSLLRLRYPRLEILVVDNAPGSEATLELVDAHYPEVRYVREDRPGLDWARNRAAMEARGEIVAYTDDDVVVDQDWVAALARVFVDSSEVMAVTGLVVPYEIETEAQALFEHYGGFGRGFTRRWVVAEDRGGRLVTPPGTGQYGTGANMAFRRSVFEKVGSFDPALDVGTVTNGGGDLEMFYRVLKEGCMLAYEPRAIVRHRHRRDYHRLRDQIRNNGIGFYSFLMRTAAAYQEDRLSILLFGCWWYWYWSVKRLLRSYFHPQRLPRDLIWVELFGSWIGLTRYFRARKTAAGIEASFPDDGNPGALPRTPSARTPRTYGGTGVRSVDIERPIASIPDVGQYEHVDVYLHARGRLLGMVGLKTNGRPIGAMRLAQAVAERLGHSLLAERFDAGTDMFWAEAMVELDRRFLPPEEDRSPSPADLAVDIVVATYDRPDDLRTCLGSLTRQESDVPMRIIVVDNHPASGLTPPVVSEFPEVELIREDRKGSSAARNAAVVDAKADIVLTIDDDVVAPPDWVSKMVAPFARNDVMIVTGNILPYELGTPAQRLFEKYGGLSRGFIRGEFGLDWYESFRLNAVPTWRLGATANAAFRSILFADRDVGMFNEMLGAGVPTGCSEDTFLFYKALRKGHTIVYEPSAYVWHKHRREMKSLYGQIYNYSKGHVAYHLMVFMHHRDFRSLFNVVVTLPLWHMYNLKRYLTSKLFMKSEAYYPLKMIAWEVLGNLAGPWALFKSWRLVRSTGQGASRPETERVVLAQAASPVQKAQDQHFLQ
jgi:O-antigen biosynthesis protein